MRNKRIQSLERMAKDKGLKVKELTDEEIEIEINRIEKGLGYTALRGENERLKKELEVATTNGNQ
jgi:hypothetical protein